MSTGDGSIELRVPIGSLGSAKVARALAELMLALGEVQAHQPAAGSTVQAFGRPQQMTSARASESSQAPVPTAASSLPSDSEARYRLFLEGLPHRSREFLNLLQARGKLRMSEALKELDVDVPKALGGIVGSISRWAPKKGVGVPFVAKKTRTGERMWRWVGSELDPNGSAGRPAITRRPQTKQGLYDDLPQPTRRFLDLLQEHGELTMSTVVKELNLASPRGMGGLTGHLTRRARRFGQPLPFVTSKTPKGERMWRWTG